MKIDKVFGVVLVISAVAVVAARAAEPGNSTLKTCVSLLPEGHEFNLNINAVISTKIGAENFDGDFSVIDGSGASPASFSQEQVSPFINCVIELIE